MAEGNIKNDDVKSSPDDICIIVPESHIEQLQSRVVVIPDKLFSQILMGLHPTLCKSIHDLFLFGIPNMLLKPSDVEDIAKHITKPRLLTPRTTQ